MNHPAAVKSRFVQLDALWRAGINRFRAYRADEAPSPSRFPVFIRREYDHNVQGRSLIYSQAELESVLAGRQSRGVPLSGHLIVEFASDEAAPGIWYRGSAYRVADEIIAHHMAIDSHWLVKDGFDSKRLSEYDRRQEFIARERSFVMDNEHSELFRRAFDSAGIEYGRADFGFLDNQIQIYEINTNPNHGSEADVFGDIHPDREAAQRFSEQRLRESLDRIHTVPTGSVLLRGRQMAAQQKEKALFIPLFPRP